MQMLERKFTLEITAEEANALSDVLNSAYKALSAEWEDEEKLNPALYEKVCTAKQFRNAFAGLINKQYMGVDA